MTYRIAGNQFRGHRFTYDELNPDASDQGHLIRLNNSDVTIEIDDNTWEAPEDFINRLPGGEGTDGNVSATGNTQQTIEPVIFRNSGLAADFDFMKLEIWTDVATLGDDAPVEYDEDDIVTHFSRVYRCRLDPCPAGKVPPENEDVWEELEPFADDVRLDPSSPHQGVGLTANP